MNELQTGLRPESEILVAAIRRIMRTSPCRIGAGSSQLSAVPAAPLSKESRVRAPNFEQVTTLGNIVREKLLSIPAGGPFIIAALTGEMDRPSARESLAASPDRRR